MGTMAKLSAPNKTPLHQALCYSIKSSVVHVRATHRRTNTRTGWRERGDYKNKTAHCLKSGHYITQPQYWWAAKFRSAANHVEL